ncbi:unnamed protein product [Peronospora farinosa]|uniref:Uncharacterized protein n=1 Tax=Peronospora farinosa TaxID=134698 RepID=A0AAV0UMR0_9STRA|nr:unnamed protein product [Peronospora farinosa]CAI5736789.1 unnamed protein product [Peronospora farinosa]
MEHRKCGDTDVTARDSEATSTQGNNHKGEEGQKIAVATGIVTEEKWSELSNLRVAGDSEETAQSQPSSSCSAVSNRHNIRRISSYAHLKTPQDDGELSKSSLSFILDDQAASAAVGKMFNMMFSGVVSLKMSNILQKTKTSRRGARYFRRRSPGAEAGVPEI